MNFVKPLAAEIDKSTETDIEANIHELASTAIAAREAENSN